MQGLLAFCSGSHFTIGQEGLVDPKGLIEGISPPGCVISKVLMLFDAGVDGLVVIQAPELD